MVAADLAREYGVRPGDLGDLDAAESLLLIAGLSGESRTMRAEAERREHGGGKRRTATVERSGRGRRTPPAKPKTHEEAARAVARHGGALL